MEKRKTAKKVLSLFLTLAMLLSMMSVAAFAEENDVSTAEDAGETNFEEFSSSEENKILSENLDDNSSNELSNELEPYVNEPDPVAQVGGTGYETLQAAIDAGGEVTLLKSTTESVTVSSTVTLNIPANVTLTNKADQHTISVAADGNLTITGSGTVDNVSHGKAALNNEGTVQEIAGCTFTRSAENGKTTDTKANNSYYTVRNIGTINLISGGRFENKGTFSSCFINGDYQNGKRSGTIGSITGGIFSGGKIALKNDPNCEIGDISGATIQGSGVYDGKYSFIALLNYGKIGTVTNTTITSSGQAVYTSGYYNDVEITLGQGVKATARNNKLAIISTAGGSSNKSTTTITGGEYYAVSANSNYATLDGTKDTLIISGGKFSLGAKDVVKTCIAEGLKFDDNGEVVSKFVAKIGDTQYESLQAAVDAAQEDDTVELLKTVKTDAALNIAEGKTVNLDLGGNTYQRESSTGNFAVINYGTLTISNGTIDGDKYGVYNGGTLNMESGTIQGRSYYGINANDNSMTNVYGTAKVIGNWWGIASSEESIGAEINVYGNAEITSTDPAATNGGISAGGATTQVYGNAKITGPCGINTNGKLEISGNVRIESTAVSGAAVGLYGGADVQIKSGTLIADTYGVSSQGLPENADAKCVITGGDISAKKVAIYWPGRDSELSISDGVKVTGKEGGSAMTVRGGKVNVTGGTFVAEHSDDPDTWEKALTGSQGWYNGSTIIIVDGHGSYKLEEVKISGGTFNSSGKPALLYVNMAGDAAAESGCLNVSGGTFTTAENNNVVVEAYAVPGKDTAKKVNARVLTGGTFSADVDDYCADGYVSHQTSTPEDYFNVHQPSFYGANEYGRDGTGHWQGCRVANCIEGRTVTAHTFGAWVTDTAAQVGVAGTRHRNCTVCGYRQNGTISALPGGGGSSGGGGGGGYRPSGGGGGGTVNIDDPDVPLAGGVELNREDHFAYVSGYEDGSVRPTNNVTREEVAAIFYRLLTETSHTLYDTDANDFSDVDSGRWSNRAISTLVNAGILTGYEDGTFRPGQDVTRAELSAIAAQFNVMIEYVENPFSDTIGHWAESPISFVADKGWVGGYEDNTFRPQKSITRAEAMVVINNILEREVDEEGLLADAKQWPDNKKDAWYYYEVLEATNSHDYTRRGSGTVENWTAITTK